MLVSVDISLYPLKESFIPTVDNFIVSLKKYKDIEEKYRLEHFQRVSKDVAESVSTHELHMELMDLLKQMNIFIELIASTLLSPELDKS